MITTTKENVRQRGNILFLILLAVVLFAALAYAVTSSMRGGGKDASSEEGELWVSQIFQQATTLEQTVNRLTLNGCKDTQLNFVNSATGTTLYSNPSAPANGSCNVYEAAGGGATFLSLPKEALNAQYSANMDYGYPFISGRNHIAGLDTGGTTNQSELLYIAPYLTEAVCIAINAKLYNLTSTQLPREDNTDLAKLTTARFAGVYGTNFSDIDGNGATTMPTGFWRYKTSGCSRTSDNIPFYFHVLVTR